MIMGRLCNWPRLRLQLAVEELVEGVERLQRVSNIICIQLPSKCPQELVNLLHDVQLA